MTPGPGSSGLLAFGLVAGAKGYPSGSAPITAERKALNSLSRESIRPAALPGGPLSLAAWAALSLVWRILSSSSALLAAALFNAASNRRPVCVRPHSREAGLADFGWHLRAARHHVRAILLTAASLVTFICWRLGHFFQQSSDH